MPGTPLTGWIPKPALTVPAMRGLKLVAHYRISAGRVVPALTVPAMRGLKLVVSWRWTIRGRGARTHRPRDEGTETYANRWPRSRAHDGARTHRPRDEGTETWQHGYGNIVG